MDNMHPLREKQLMYFKRLKSELDARKSRAELIDARKLFLQNQNVSNYTNEYRRLKGIYNNSTVDTTKEAMKKRMAELQTLGASAVNSLD